MIQQDFAAIGIGVRIVTLDLPSLIERITRTLLTMRVCCQLSPRGLNPRGASPAQCIARMATGFARHPSQLHNRDSRLVGSGRLTGMN